MLPGFLGIGAQKAGTSWLHAMLSMHPEIWLPRLKELHYFDRKFPIAQAGGAPASRPGRARITRHLASRLRRIDATKLKERLHFRRWRDFAWEFRYAFGKWDDDWYASLFDEARGRLAGEITPAYSCLGDTAVGHVHKLMPNAKIILLLRNPIDRAWSHARMDLAKSTGRDLAEISDTAYVAHFDGCASRLRGDYLGTIRKWRTYFPARQLFVGFYDEIQSNPEDLLLKIFRFLGVSSAGASLPRQIRTRINPGQQATIPPQLHIHLATLYVDDIRKLALQYGTYPQQWLDECESLISRVRGQR